MSNPRLFTPARAELHEIAWKRPPPRPNGDVYMLAVISTDCGDREWTSLVHVAPAMKTRFDQGEVESFDLHDVDLNGPATWAMPLQPEHVVLGVRLKAGSVVTETPAAFVAARRKRIRQALCLAAAAAVGIFYGTLWTVAPVALAIYLTHKAARIPVAAHPGLAG